MTFYSFLLPIQVITLSIAIFKYKEYKSRFMSLLCLLLFLIIVVESLGRYLLILEISSMKFYNIYTFFEYNIITMMYYSIINNKKSREFIKYISALFNIVYFVSFIHCKLQNNTLIIGSVMVSVFLIMYLSELLQSNKILNYKKLLPFWVSVGFLVFYLSSIPFFSMINYMYSRGLFFILYILIILMNIFIIYGLLCSKKEKY